MSNPNITLIAGLGNPGTEYEGTRHNAGFMFIERFLARLPGTWEKVHAFNSYYWKGTYAGQKLLLQTPLTFMNLSGNAVSALAKAEDVAPEQIMIVYDDMDLPPGRIRIRNNGSSGGHNGINSIIDRLGTQKFPRVRIGIGKMANGHGSADFVLSEFTAADRAMLDKVLDMTADAVILAIRRGLSMAMANYNNRDLAAEEAAAGSDDEKTNNETNTLKQQ